MGVLGILITLSIATLTALLLVVPRKPARSPVS
jgi:hypothetical protein